MAFQNTDIGGRANSQYKQYICDTKADLEPIPEEFTATVLVLKDESNSNKPTFYVCNSELEWVKI